MRNLTDVSIKRLVVHLLDCSPGGNTVYSDIPIDVSSSSVLERYFRERVIKVSQDEFSGMAVLSDKYEEVMKPLYQKVVYQEDGFISGARSFAERLHGIMEEDLRIVPGVLAVCIFTVGDASEEPMLALLKLNVTHAIIHRESKDEEGYSEVKLEVIPDALPTVGERLQKAALIWKSKNPGWKMLVLDRQVGRGEEHPAAHFFRRFLGAEWQLNDEALTHRLFGALTGIASKLYKSDDPKNWALADSLFQLLDAALAEKSFNPNNFIDNLNVEEDTKHKIGEELKKAKVEREFVIHQRSAEKLTSKVRYRGDDDLVLTASADVYKRLVKETPIKKKKGGSMKKIQITTHRWQRIRRRR